jgi:hypothetical protein
MNTGKRILIAAVLAAISTGQPAYAICSGSQFAPMYLGTEVYNAEHSIGSRIWNSDNSPTSFGASWLPYFDPFGFQGDATGPYGGVSLADTPVGRVLIGLYVLQNAYWPQASNDQDLSGPIVKWAWPESYQQYYGASELDMNCTDLNSFAYFYHGIYVNGTWYFGDHFVEESGAWYNESPIERASTLFHEAIHRTGREHDCGNFDSSWEYGGAYMYQTSWLMDYFEESNNFTNNTLKLWAAEQANARLYDGVFCTQPPASVLNWVGAGPFPPNNSGGDQAGDDAGQCAPGAVACGCPSGYTAAPPNGNCVKSTGGPSIVMGESGIFPAGYPYSSAAFDYHIQINPWSTAPTAGVYGYTYAFDSAPGVGDSFYYEGPQNTYTGPFTITAPPGCHSLWVRAWDDAYTTSVATSGVYCVGTCDGPGGGGLCQATQGQECCEMGTSCASDPNNNGIVACHPTSEVCGTTYCPAGNTCLPGAGCCENDLVCNGECLRCTKPVDCGGFGDACGHYIECGPPCPSGYICSNNACVVNHRCPPGYKYCNGKCIAQTAYCP